MTNYRNLQKHWRTLEKEELIKLLTDFHKANRSLGDKILKAGNRLDEASKYLVLE